MRNRSKVLVCLVLICALTLSGCASLIPDDMSAQAQTIDDLTVSMPVYFENLSVYDDTVSTSGFFMYGYSEIVITGLRDDKAQFEEVPTLEEYAKQLIANSEAEAEIQVIDGMTTFTYYQLKGNQSYTCFAAVFEGTDSFWLVTGSCQTMNFKYAQEKFVEIFSSIRVA